MTKAGNARFVKWLEEKAGTDTVGILADSIHVTQPYWSQWRSGSKMITPLYLHLFSYVHKIDWKEACLVAYQYTGDKSWQKMKDWKSPLEGI